MQIPKQLFILAVKLVLFLQYVIFPKLRLYLLQKNYVTDILICQNKFQCHLVV